MVDIGGVVRESLVAPFEAALGLGGEQFLVPAEAPGLVIRERSGRRRSITLKNRLLPYRKPEWGTTQRSKLTFYQGNPEGTQQILGPMPDSVIFTGLWREKYVPGSAEVSGFDTPTQVEDLARIFQEFAVSGSVLDVQWAFLKRRGILKRFKLRPERVEDQEWELEFEWFSDGTEAPRVTGFALDLSAITGSMNDLSDLVAFDPLDTLAAFQATALQLVNDIQAAVNEFLGQVQQVITLINAPGRLLQAVSSAATEVAFAVGGLLQLTAETSYTAATNTDSTAELLGVDVWKRNLAFFGATVRESVQNASRNVQAREQPAALRVVRMDESGSLRVLAQREYGNADSWTAIADANGFDSARVEPGTEIFIPPLGNQLQSRPRE